MLGMQRIESYSGTGTNAADVLFTTASLERHNSFTLLSTAGSVTVEVSLDGATFAATAIAMEDQTSTTPTTRVTSTTAGKPVIFRGKYRVLRVKQNGATASAATLIAGCE